MQKIIAMSRKQFSAEAEYRQVTAQSPTSPPHVRSDFPLGPDIIITMLWYGNHHNGHSAHAPTHTPNGQRLVIRDFLASAPAQRMFAHSSPAMYEMKSGQQLCVLSCKGVRLGNLARARARALPLIRKCRSLSFARTKRRLRAKYGDVCCARVRVYAYV